MQSDTSVTLPHPQDIQVATAWREVERLRWALIHAGRLRYNARTHRTYRDDAHRRWPGDDPDHVRVRQRSEQRYQDAAREAAEAESKCRELERQALQVAPQAVARLHLSARAYTARLAAEADNPDACQYFS